MVGLARRCEGYRASPLVARRRPGPTPPDTNRCRRTARGVGPDCAGHGRSSRAFAHRSAALMAPALTHILAPRYSFPDRTPVLLVHRNARADDAPWAVQRPGGTRRDETCRRQAPRVPREAGIECRALPRAPHLAGFATRRGLFGFIFLVRRTRATARDHPEAARVAAGGRCSSCRCGRDRHFLPLVFDADRALPRGAAVSRRRWWVDVSRGNSLALPV